MANTAVSVCSNALSKLGDDPITSLTDNTNRARLCNRLFEPTRQAVLREAVWNDSLKRARLARSTDTPAWEFAYQYALPSDYMRMARTSLDEYDIPYKIEGRFLLTDSSEVYVTYVYDNTDVASYDSLHIDALTARLAYELSLSVTAKRSYAEQMWAEWEVKKKEAKVVDGQENFQDENTDSTLVDARA